MKALIIATRASKLALYQAGYVRDEIKKLRPGIELELLKIKTTGDKILDVPLAKVGGKGLFVKEIEEALLGGNADLAVHSMKDVPTDLPKGLRIGAMLKREDPRDAFISKKYLSFEALPEGATVGTSSLRRSCQILNIRPDLNIVSLRGNLDTRIRRLDEGRFDAIIVACAGVKRLGLKDRITELLDTLPAMGQGAIGIECRAGDDFAENLIEPLNDKETALCVRAERAFLGRLEGGCQVPIAGHAKLAEGRLVMEGLVGSIAGDRLIRGRAGGMADDPESVGIHLAEELLSRGAREILDEVYRRTSTPE